MLDFAKKMFEHLLISAFSSPLTSKNLKYEIQAQKARKSERNRKKPDEDAMFCKLLCLLILLSLAHVGKGQ